MCLGVYLGFSKPGLNNGAKIRTEPKQGFIEKLWARKIVRPLVHKLSAKPAPKSNHTVGTLVPQLIPGWHLDNLCVCCVVLEYYKIKGE